MNDRKDYWVAPRLTDGLGNRLFQYACAVNYAFQEKKRCVFFLPRSMKTDHGDFNSIFKMFPKTEIVETESSWEEIKEKCEHYGYDEVKFNIDNNLVIQGYRQNLEYFESIELKPNFLHAIGVNRLEELNKLYLSEKEKLFFIHIRLGDYKFLAHHQMDIQKYYNEAIKHIPSDTKIMLFSDEIELCGTLFKNILESNNFNVTLSDITDEVETLYLMSQCAKGCITANSTFSYWGAYFLHQNYGNAICVYPKKFGKGLPEPKNLFPSYAILVDSL